ncbi:MAG: UPF0179 family protein [Candidatus Verstraetearchaeota archaeon]|uniref:UPF0179 protein DSO08_05910 n=1 Tax=Thermoproteota archaeon TaxID=2056631 RepID=A0A523B8Y6_9CREN|nr:UPF0179 family protein [Candidatus Methanomethylicia archaeon]NHV61170.1 UPF0179 family protein [Candidatus Verstraetearchaeota archaeon]TDA37334.1 MAG: hypothetical protein DSO08_05910 [Candidatus Verstraetearchaeota archaeon]
MKEIVTMVGEGQASKGFRFVASTPPEVCKRCRLFSACMGRLVPGRVYEVIEVRDKWHYCELYEGKVVVAKVAEAPMEVLVKAQFAVEGAIISFVYEDCREKGCTLKGYCMPEGIKKGTKVKITKIMEDVSELALCGKNLRKVHVITVE